MNQSGGLSLPIPMSKEDQYIELASTVKCRLTPSKVHGVGVSALRDIKMGEQLNIALKIKPRWYTLTFDDLSKFFDKTYPEIKQLILDRWPNVVNGAAFLSPNYDARLMSFLNHSDTPNYDPRSDLALTDIKKGEEIFEDYRIMKNYEQVYGWLPKPVKKVEEGENK